MVLTAPAIFATRLASIAVCSVTFATRLVSIASALESKTFKFAFNCAKFASAFESSVLIFVVRVFSCV